MRISNGIQNRNRRMPNGTYGGVRGRKTKVGRKLLRFPPTRFHADLAFSHADCFLGHADFADGADLFSLFFLFPTDFTDVHRF